MKSQSFFKLLGLFLAVLITFSLSAQDDITTDSTGYPGDGFSLEGALELFKESKNLEDFEKKLNSEDNSVNNLDLNEDNEVDYIRVVDNMEDKVHAVVLTVPLNEKESQDVAVIEIEEKGKENTILQIVGDEDVYGEQTLVEPYEEEAKSDGKGGPSTNARIARVVVTVHLWPCVRFMYRPSYVVYASPWGWRVYPTFWRPWRPYPWHVHHSRVVVHRRHYHRVHTHRVVHAHRVYTPHRRTTTVVRTRTTTVRTTNAKRTTNNRAATANKKASTANQKASTANKKASTANQKASTANKKASTANQKTTKANKKANTGNKKASTANTKAASGNKSTKAKSTQKRSSQQKKSTQKRSSQQKSSKQGNNRNRSGNRGGNKKRGNR